MGAGRTEVRGKSHGTPAVRRTAAEVTNDVIACVYAHGGYAWRAASGGVFDAKGGVWRTSAKKGVADVIACYRGRLVAVEVKIGKDKLSPEQEGFSANVRHAGGFFCVVNENTVIGDFWETLEAAIGY